MANIPLKTIKFPGLDDTYTIPQVDNTLAVTGAAADAKKTGDEIGDLKEALTDINGVLPTKADKSGVVASAEQLLSDIGTEDKAPYLFRATPYDSTRVDEEVVGCSVGWNQLIPDAKIHLTETVAEDVTAEKWGSNIATLSDVVIDHVYFAISSLQNGKCIPSWASGYSLLGESVGEQTRTYSVYKATAVIVSNKSAVFRLKAGLTAGTYEADINLIDLTAWFGSTIADYAYTLEQATAGSGVSFIKQFLPGGYIPYSAPKMESVSGLSGHKFTGFNWWDEVAEIGNITNSGGNGGSTDRIRSKNYIPILPSTQYHANVPSPAFIRLAYYDANKTFISYSDISTRPLTFITPSNAYYLRFNIGNDYGTVYNHDICINLSDPARNGQYEPYKATTYALDSDLTLRGIWKMDADHNVYADGDVYKSDGTVERRFAEVDLGSLDWTYGTWGTNSCFSLTSVLSDMKSGGNAVCSAYPKENASVIYGETVNKVFCVNNQIIRVVDSAYTDAATFKTAMSGVYLVYELATPTTETADPYASPQNCEPDGTEEYVYAEGGSGIPVGHNSKYLKNMRSELERVSDAVPVAPSVAGTYSLKATVTSSGVTYGWVAD